MLGGERSMLATLPALHRAGFHATVACPVKGLLSQTVQQRGISLVEWSLHDPHGQRRKLSDLRLQLAALLRVVEPDLVHANSLSMARLAGPVVDGCDLPSVGHLRDIVKVSRQAVEDLNCHRCLIAVSGATRKFHISQGVDPHRCVVSHNGVALDEFAPQVPTGYLHQELGLPETVRFVVTIGQLGIRKGIDIALEAVRRVACERPDIHWLVVGERTSTKDESREFEADVRRSASAGVLSGRTHFLGTRSDVHDVLCESCLLLHAARQEPLGRVLLESAAAGVPVVATDVGGTSEIFPTTGDGGLLVPSESPAAMAAAALALLGDESRRRACGQQGRKRAEEAFDIEFTAERLAWQYETLLS